MAVRSKQIEGTFKPWSAHSRVDGRLEHNGVLRHALDKNGFVAAFGFE
jgi:hypothetical protein